MALKDTKKDDKKGESFVFHHAFSSLWLSEVRYYRIMSAANIEDLSPCAKFFKIVAFGGLIDECLE